MMRHSLPMQNICACCSPSRRAKWKTGLNEEEALAAKSVARTPAPLLRALDRSQLPDGNLRISRCHLLRQSFSVLASF